MIKKKPKTNLRFNELLGEHPITVLARHMGVTYTKLYPYKKEGANPTLKGLEDLAEGFGKLLGREVKISELLQQNIKKKKKKGS